MTGIKKIKGAAMQLALLIATVVALLLSSFLLLTHTHSLFRTQSNQLFDVIEGANKGMRFTFSSEKYGADSVIIANDLSKTIVKKEHWGAFEKIQATTHKGSKSFSKMAFTAGGDIKKDLAIYVCNTNLPLVLAGTAHIQGNAFVPDRGVKAGVISGNYFQGKTLINGHISQSNLNLPELDPDWLQYVKAVQQYIPSTKDEPLDLQLENQQSFFEPTQYLYTSERLFTSEKYVGNIMLISTSEIIIGPQTQLTDVLVVAPKITIQSGFHGNATFIAEEQVIVEQNVHLNYPSSIIVAAIHSEEEEEENLNTEETPILISNNANVEGSVIYLVEAPFDSNSKNRSRVHIRTEPNAKVHGMVYCMGNLEHLGAVSGSVYTQKFIASAEGSKYINHLYNGSINALDRHADLYSILFSNTQKTTVKWLY